MAQVTVKVTSDDETFLDFYEPLARSLGDAGTVYTPHPVMPLNARMPIPRPNHVLVVCEGGDCLPALAEAVRRYLEGAGGRQLRLDQGDHRVEADSSRVPGQADLAAALSWPGGT